MAAPLSSGLSSPFPSAQSDWQMIAVAGAIAGALSPGQGAGIDGSSFNQCFVISNFNGGHDGINHYSAYHQLATALDLSQPQQALWFHTRPQGNTFTILSNAADAIQVALFSGAGTGNWVKWNLGGSESAIYPLNQGAYIKWRVPQGVAPDASAGVFDASNVTGVAFLYRLSSGGSFNFEFRIDQPIYVNGPVVWSEGDGVTPGNIAEYIALHEATSGESYHSNLLSKSECFFPVRFNTTNFSDQEVAFTFGELDDLGRPMNDGYYSLEFSTVGTLDFDSSLFRAEGSGSFDLTINGGNLVGCIFSRLGDVVIAGGTLDGSRINAPENLDLAGANTNNLAIPNPVNPIVWSSPLVAGSSFETNVDINVTFDVGDYSSTFITLTASTEFTVSPSTDAGIYDFSGIDNTGFTTNFDIPAGNGNDTTVRLPSTLTVTRTGPPTTGGGTLTFDNSVNVPITSLITDAVDGSPIESARIQIVRDSDLQLLYQLETNAAGQASDTFVYTGTPVNVSGWVRQFDLAGFDYVAQNFSGVIGPNGLTINRALRRQ